MNEEKKTPPPPVKAPKRRAPSEDIFGPGGRMPRPVDADLDLDGLDHKS